VTQDSHRPEDAWLALRAAHTIPAIIDLRAAWKAPLAAPNTSRRSR